MLGGVVDALDIAFLDDPLDRAERNPSKPCDFDLGVTRLQ